ncbi:ABC transporter ATP-binding protein [Streptomyces sp. NPDC015131]|uniref:ABC transporter ATP-binding protein n=1 Tax=Streptomyces sp. NPDC015131 TaxID=3364941 RepID=UPI0036F87353
MSGDSTAAGGEGRGDSADLRVLRELTAGRAPYVAAIAVLSLLSAAATLALPMVVGTLVREVQEGRGLTWTAGAMVGVGVGAAMAGALAAYLLSRLGERLIRRLRVRTMRHALGLRVADARREGSGNLASRLTADAMQLKAAIDIGPIQLPMAALTLVGTLVIMGVLDWMLLLITMAGFLTALVIVAAVVMGLRRKYGALQDELGALTEQFVTTLDALTVIKAHRAEHRVAGVLAARAESLSRLGTDVARLESLVVPVINLGQQIALLTVLVGGGARLVSGDLALADFVAFLLYLLQLTAPLVMAASGASTLQAGIVAKKRFTSVFALPVESVAPDRRPVPPPARPGAPAVRFDRVTFGYGDRPVLREVDLTVPATGLTAVVGLSGAGKSTVLGLVEHFMTPHSGRVEVFGHDLAGLPLGDLRGQLAYVDQGFTLVRDSIRMNLELGREDALPDEALWDALARVGLDQEIRRLPDGLDTVLNGGQDLSGGQRQRLALARAALTDARLVLLDEPSSQLDSVNEQRLRRVVDGLARERAVLVVAHRISTVQHADQVIVMDQGQVVAQGTHIALLDTCPAYAELVAGQLLSTLETTP